MFIKFGDKTKKIEIKNGSGEKNDEEEDNENEEESDESLYGRRAELLKKYEDKNYTKIYNN